MHDKRVKYWFSEAYDSLPSAFVLTKSKQYIEAAFFNHLAVEKAVKGIYQLRKMKTPPKKHNLIELAAECDMQLTQEQIHLLSTLNYFQQQGRYPTNRRKLLNTYPPDFFDGLGERVATFLKDTTKIVKKEQFHYDRSTQTTYRTAKAN
jgi:HEPN domain-containing protein